MYTVKNIVGLTENFNSLKWKNLVYTRRLI